MGNLVPFFLSITFLVVVAQLSPSSLALTSKLFRGNSLSVDRKVDDVLVSPNGIFTCGFHELGGNAVSFSIWFSDDVTPSSQRTVVWSAARDQPLNNQRSRVVFRKDGNLVLIDGTSDSPVWTTNTTGPSAATIQLLNTGNLVVEDQHGQIIWQSFQYPTDTLLPGQLMTKDVKLVASIFPGSVSSGNHILFYDNDNSLKLMYSVSEVSSIYWPNPDQNLWQNGRSSYNSTKLGVLDDVGRFSSSDRLNFNASDMDRPDRRRLTLDPDGNLRLYSLQGSSRTWAVSWQAISAPCRIHGLCGRNGICTYGHQPCGNDDRKCSRGGLTPICSCPPGYMMANSTNWKEGCRPVFNVSSCGVDRNSTTTTSSVSRKWKFVKIPQADFYGYDVVFNQKVSLKTCRKACEDDCNCFAFAYHRAGEGNCYTKAELHNGYTSPDFPGTLYIKVPIDLNVTASITIHKPQCASIPREGVRPDYLATDVETPLRERIKRNANRLKWIYAYVFVTLFGAIEFLFIFTGWWFLYRRSDGAGAPRYRSYQDGYRVMFDQFRKFTYTELKRATGNFKEELGRGGSGTVYKGVLDDKRVVAVKKLADVDVGRGEDEFRAELSLIGRIYHMNLVSMLGFCLERSTGLLIYEFVENGSLDRHLFRREDDDSADVLDWPRRFDIALGTARGLAYLHDECLEWIIHCDIKPENILLDAEYRPKIADFGLVKLNERGRPGSAITRIRGTKGYMAPEWTSNVPITSKVDVYSYGVILLELIRGARLSSWVTEQGQEPGFRGIVRELKHRLATEKEGPELCHEFVDPRLQGEIDEQQATALLVVAVSCLEEERNKRPCMNTVVQMLSAHAKILELSASD